MGQKQGGYNFCCSPSRPCDVGEGACDEDVECAGDLICGDNNCVGDAFDEGDGCCSKGHTY